MTKQVEQIHAILDMAARAPSCDDAHKWAQVAIIMAQTLQFLDSVQRD